jgi:outer membrane murein-binding lipoprotein Lpp
MRRLLLAGAILSGVVSGGCASGWVNLEARTDPQTKMRVQALEGRVERLEQRLDALERQGAPTRP